MTHTLHRLGLTKNLEKDYVIFMITARGYNELGAKEKLIKFFKIAEKYNPINSGNTLVGNKYRNPNGRLNIENQVDRSLAHAVFSDLKTVKKVIKELKEEDLGLSVVVSGLFENIEECCKELKITPHTVEYSLGIFGNVNLLPSKEVMYIRNMCGHSLVSTKLIDLMIEEVQTGKRNTQEAANELCKQCICSIFNKERAAEILEEITKKE